MFRHTRSLIIAFLTAPLLVATIGMGEAVGAVRIKDVATVHEEGHVQLIGYGLVAGLSGTGDGTTTQFTVQSLGNMLEKLGINVDSDRVRVRNVAAVIATADVPAHARPGYRADITVSALGDARSLRGGTLILTQLLGPDGELVGSAQGPVVVGGFSVNAGNHGSMQKNVATVGRVVGGAMITRPPLPDAPPPEFIAIDLHQPDYASAQHLAAAVNKALKSSDAAHATTAGRIEVAVTEELRKQPGAVVDFVATIETVEFEDDQAARVVVDERTGTVVVGANVRLASAAVSHGSLSIEIRDQTLVSQPGAFSSGQTVVADQVDASVTEESGTMVEMREAVTVQDVVQALNDLGASSRDLINILQALHRAGALKAELVVL